MKEENVSAGVRRIVEQFVAKAVSIYGKKLKSVMLYGSAASGEFSQRHSNINLLVVLEDTSLKSLKKIKGLSWQFRFRNISPLFFSEDYIARSLDVFPVEFQDIRENYVVFYGQDTLRDLSIDTKNLRFQCEQELKSKLIRLRSVYVRSNSKADLTDLLIRSFTSVMHLSRNLLRLKGINPAYKKEKLIPQLASEFHIKTEIFKKLLDIKNDSRALGMGEIDSLLDKLATEIEKIITIVDQL